MEIGHIRKELTELLDNIVEHSRKYAEDRTIPSLEVSMVLTKINRLHERMAVLKYLLEEQENEAKHQRQLERALKTKALIEEVEPVKVAAPKPEIPIVQEEAIKVEHEIDDEIEESTTEEGEAAEEADQPKFASLFNALTLNDRYLFANELFKKDMSAFNELVKAIDTCSSFEEAQQLYFSLDWEIDNEHVISFTSLVERRFSE
jgi:hypothetical protein